MPLVAYILFFFGTEDESQSIFDIVEITNIELNDEKAYQTTIPQSFTPKHFCDRLRRNEQKIETNQTDKTPLTKIEANQKITNFLKPAKGRHSRLTLND